MDLTILATFAFLLTLKHSICDLALQRLFPANKIFYFDPPAHVHYFHHGLGSLLCGLIIGWQFALIIGVIDYFAHWHIDYTKHRVQLYWNLGRKDKAFWWVTVVDQLLHFLTYYIFVVYLVN